MAMGSGFSRGLTTATLIHSLPRSTVNTAGDARGSATPSTRRDVSHARTRGGLPCCPFLGDDQGTACCRLPAGSLSLGPRLLRAPLLHALHQSSCLCKRRSSRGSAR